MMKIIFVYAGMILLFGALHALAAAEGGMDTKAAADTALAVAKDIAKAEHALNKSCDSWEKAGKRCEKWGKELEGIAQACVPEDSSGAETDQSSTPPSDGDKSALQNNLGQVKAQAAKLKKKAEKEKPEASKNQCAQQVKKLETCLKAFEDKLKSTENSCQ